MFVNISVFRLSLEFSTFFTLNLETTALSSRLRRAQLLQQRRAHGAAHGAHRLGARRARAARHQHPHDLPREPRAGEAEDVGGAGDADHVEADLLRGEGEDRGERPRRVLGVRPKETLREDRLHGEHM